MWIMKKKETTPWFLCKKKENTPWGGYVIMYGYDNY